MNPFFQQMLGAIARVVIVWIAARTGHDLTNDQAAQIVLEYVIPAAVLGWSLYQKYKGRQKLVTALATPGVMTEKQVERIISEGGAASVMTQKADPPQ